MFTRSWAKQLDWGWNNLCAAQTRQLECIVASEASTDAGERVADSRTKRFLVIDLLRQPIFGIINAGNQAFPLITKLIVAKAKIGVRL